MALESTSEMNFSRPPFVALAAILTVATHGQVAYTPPVGGEVLTIDGGSVAAPVTTPLALTLTDRPAASGRMRGAVSLVNGNTLTVTGAGWTAAALAHPDFPYDVLLVTGAGAGARLAVTANSAEELTVTGRDLGDLGVVAGDQFQLLPVDTLDSFFGPDTFLGGDSPAAADVVALGEQDRASYYYNTTNAQWQLTVGSTADQGATRLPPNGMIAVVRKSGTFALTLVGAVPVTRTNIPVANLGNTYTHTGFPIAMSLGDLAVQTRLAGWVSHSDAAEADLLAVAAGASWVTYFHNGNHWQRTPGASTDRDAVIVPAGTPIRIVKRSGSTGITPLILPLPYSL